MKGYYCEVDRRNTEGKRDFLHVFAHEFCLEGFGYRASDAVNYVIGQGDTVVAEPLRASGVLGQLGAGDDRAQVGEEVERAHEAQSAGVAPSNEP